MNFTLRVASLRRLAVLSLLALTLQFSSPDGAAAIVTVDFSRTNGLIRPLHGVNLGPLCYRGTVDLSAYHRELGIPLTRLHDVVWVNADAVDVSTIFRDFRNDPADAASYDFRTTDDYLRAITNVGSRIVYRLGESIEHTPRKYRVHPPPDPQKWAAICIGIIRHYREGWAGGFNAGVAYWEIWNEPDIGPAMWTGTEEEFLRLYEITARAIKARFPEVKVGGPGLGGTGEFKDGAFVPTRFLTNFLARCRLRDVPLDFLSWHRYGADPWDLPRRAQAMRAVLDAHGFAKTESHLNEWNYLPHDDWRPMLKDGQGTAREKWFEEMGGPAGAAFATAGLLLLQDAPVDAANFYTGEIQGFGLFSINGVPKKSFYGFKAFRQLLDTPLSVAATTDEAGAVAVSAGVNAARSDAAVLVSRLTPGAGPLTLTLHRLPWHGATRCEVFVVDATHNFEPVRRERLEGPEPTLALAETAPAVWLVKLRPAPGGGAGP